MPSTARPDNPGSVPERTSPPGLRTRTFVLAAVFIFLGALWVRYSGLMTFMGNVGNSVPPIPSLAALLVMALAVPALNRLSPHLGLTRRELTSVYAMTLVGVPMSSLGIVRHMLPSLTALYYFATPENRFDEFQRYHPDWLVPKDEEAIRTCYEGLDAGPLPWSEWTTPLVAWSLLLVLLFLTLLCLATLLRPQWAENERLSFPVVTFALDLVDEQREGSAFSAYLRNPLLWVGFLLSAMFNGLNVVHALMPSSPALGHTFNVGALLTEPPWTAIRPLLIYYRPEFTGIGYLVPMEVLQSTWIFYFLLKVQALVSNALGYQEAGIPFAKEQGSGAYVAMSLVFVFMARRQFLGAARELLGVGKAAHDADAPFPRRFALLGLAIGFAGIIAWCNAAGMTAALAIPYVLLLITFATTFSRVRAEAGVPSMWVFPFEEQKRLILNLTGSAAWSHGGDFRSLTLLSTMLFLGRGYFPSMMAYQLENLELSKRTGTSAGRMVLGMVLFLVFGLVVAYWAHLTAYYEYGQNVLEGGITAGGYRTSLAYREFGQLAALTNSPTPADPIRTRYTVVGLVVTLGLVFTRTRLLRFPLHPLGYCMATTYGYLLWAPLMLCWLVKLTVLKLGGVKLYQQTVPFFIGLAFGHFFAAGIAWSIVGALLPGEAFREYHVDIG